VTASDPGLEVVARLRETLEPGGEWSVPGPRGFTWWPAVFSQRVLADGAATVAGLPAWRVHVELPLLRGVEGGATRFAVLARWNAVRPGLSALRWNGDDRTVSLRASAIVREGGAPRAASVLATAALLQLADAERDRAALGGELGGVPADTAPPGGTPRATADPLLEGWRRVAASGAESAPFDRGRLGALAAADPPPWKLVHVDEAGLHAELPCALPGEAPAGSGPGAGVALFHLLVAEPHPVYGPGLVVALSLPREAEPVPERAVSTSVMLNEAEAREAPPFDALGGWCVHPHAGLSYVGFWPALLDEPGLPASLAWEAGRRARWARAFLARAHALRGPAPDA